MAGFELTQVALIASAAALGGLLLHRLRQPILVGYVLAGVLLGKVDAFECTNFDLFREGGIALWMDLMTLAVRFASGTWDHIAKGLKVRIRQSCSRSR